MLVYWLHSPDSVASISCFTHTHTHTHTGDGTTAAQPDLRPDDLLAGQLGVESVGGVMGGVSSPPHWLIFSAILALLSSGRLTSLSCTVFSLWCSLSHC